MLLKHVDIFSNDLGTLYLFFSVRANSKFQFVRAAFSSRVRVMIRFSVWLVSCYAHVFVLP